MIGKIAAYTITHLGHFLLFTVVVSILISEVIKRKKKKF